MSVSALLAKLTRLGIEVGVDGDRIWYSPRSAVTPDLVDRMRALKADLLVMLRPASELGTCEDCGQNLIETPTFDGFLNLECPVCDRCLGCRPSTSEIADRFAVASKNPIAVSDDAFQVIGEVLPCPECGTLELWQSLAGNWRCLRCDPPTKARRLQELAARRKTISHEMESVDC